MKESQSQAEALGIDGTPALFVEGERINGAMPEEQLWMVIDRALRAAGEQPPPPDKPEPAAAPKARWAVKGPAANCCAVSNVCLPGLRVAELSCSAGSRCGFRGEIRLQVDSVVRAPARRSVFILGFGTLLMLSACQRAPSADVVATVNGKEIMRADLEKLYKASLDQSQQEPSPEQANIVRLKTLEGMIDDEILQQRAAKLNLAASDEDVNAKLTEMKAPFTQEEFDRQLKQRGLTLDDLKRQTRRALTRQADQQGNRVEDQHHRRRDRRLLQQPQGRVQSDRAALSSGADRRYRRAPAAGPCNRRRRAPNEAEAKKEIQSLRNRIDSGEDFGTLAAQFSENANFASNGGDMGFIAESQLKTDADVYNAVNALKPGQVTQPLPIFDTSGPGHKLMGYALYKLFGREAAGQRELKDPRVQQSIRQTLRDAQDPAPPDRLLRDAAQ